MLFAVLLFLAIATLVSAPLISRQISLSRSKANAEKANVMLSPIDSDGKWNIKLTPPQDTNVVITAVDLSVEFVRNPVDEGEARAVENFVKLRPNDISGYTTPCYNQVLEGETFSWPDSCRGTLGQTCYQGKVSLTPEEKERYLIWTRHGKPSVPGCAEAKTSGSSSQSTDQSSVVSLEEKEIFSQEGLIVTTGLSDIFKFEPITIENISENKGTLRIKAAVSNAEGRSKESIQQILRSMSSKLVSIKTPFSVNAKLVNYTVKGTTPASSSLEIVIAKNN